MVFKYKQESFECDFIPVCNLCGYKLIINKGYKFYSIIKCTNNTCKSNKGLFNKLNAFLPESIAKIRIAKYKEKTKSNRKNNILYWTKKGFSEDEAKKKVSEFQITFSKEICIEKYGIEKGLEIFNKRNKNWTNSLRDNCIKNGDGRSIQSKWAKEIIDIICQKLNIKFPEKETYLYDKKYNRAYAYDFTYENKIIEFNGNYWHANPLMYNKDDFIRNKHVKDIWEYDKRKIQLAKNKKYDVLVIWESDDENIIDKCYNFLNNGKKIHK